MICKIVIFKPNIFQCKSSCIYYLFLVIVLLSVCNARGQKITPVYDIKGMSFISGDISPNQAKIQALNDAKISALKTAGIEENISTYQLLFTSQIKNDYTQFFNSDIQSEMRGAIKSYILKNERIYCKSENEIVCEVNIDADIIKYDTKPDITLDAYIEGIKAAYNNDDKLTFNITTTQQCYLTIFNITDNDAFVLLPNAYEKQFQLISAVEYKFPIAKIDYILHTDMKQQETNRLIFVFTKTLIPFIKMDKEQVTTQENIFSWIYSIMPDQRKVEYFTLIIQK